MISVQSLRIDYENVNAVNDVSFSVLPGQIFGLVGPNGAGKTSLIKAMAGVLEPTYGDIKIAGVDLELDPQNALQQLGYMPDFSPVYENLKVWEFLDVFGAAYLIPFQDRRPKVDYWIEQVNLKDKTNCLVRELSRGMKQRLVLAKTLLHEPSVLLLDEPASGLDPIARKEMSEVLKRVAAERKAIIISSHILSELSDFCNSIGVMEKGKMLVSGTIDEIRSQLNQKAVLTVRLINDSLRSERLRTFLESSKYIEKLEQISSTEYSASFNGAESDAAWLLSEIVRQDIPVFEFILKKQDLQDLFFKIGAKAVS